MLLAIFTKYRKKDSWQLYHTAPTIEKANSFAQEAKEVYSKMGFDTIETTIQAYSNIMDIPQTLQKPKEEKLLYS